MNAEFAKNAENPSGIDSAISAASAFLSGQFQAQAIQGSSARRADTLSSGRHACDREHVAIEDTARRDMLLPSAVSEPRTNTRSAGSMFERQR